MKYFKDIYTIVHLPHWPRACSPPYSYHRRRFVTASGAHRAQAVAPVNVSVSTFNNFQELFLLIVLLLLFVISNDTPSFQKRQALQLALTRQQSPHSTPLHPSIPIINHTTPPHSFSISLIPRLTATTTPNPLPPTYPPIAHTAHEIPLLHRSP